MRPTRSRPWFTRFAKSTAKAAGRPLTFTLAAVVIATWAITGPLFGFSDTWQLVINTGTTIVTFLMVFLIQNTQNRDSGGHNVLLDLEELEEEELDRIRQSYCKIAEDARDKLRRGLGDTDVPEVKHQKRG